MVRSKLGLTVNEAPHIHSQQHTRQIMLDVFIALIPSLLAAAWLLGLRSLLLFFTSVFCCILFEYGFCILLKKRVTIGDASSLVTGTLLSFCFSITTPLWMVALGAFIAIVIVKLCFGGLGNNYMNPALTASFAVVSIRNYILPLFASPAPPAAIDAISRVTPLMQMKQGILPDADLLDMLFQKSGGSIGEASSILLILGFFYLLAREVIKPRITLAYLSTVAISALLFPHSNDPLLWMLYNLLGGSVLIGAIFFATDYASSPVTPRGQWLYGIGCGVINMLFRYCGTHTEGVTYAILIMNLFARPLDRIGAPRRYGRKRSNLPY